MIYYRVKPEYDNKYRLTLIGHHTDVAKYDGVLIGGELYTPRERAKLLNHEYCFDKIEMPKSKIYWFFGARFEKSDVFERVYTVLSVGELADILNDLTAYEDIYQSAADAINTYLYPENAEYSPEDITRLKELVLQYASCPSDQENTILCKVLSIVTGRK